MTNDNEIIKALECCVQNTREACVECPIGFEGRDLCLNVAMEEAIGLINRQKAEIERLERVVSIKQKNKQTIKSEAIKEFAKRLKEVMVATHKDINGYRRYETEDYYIDKLVKEMVGE